MSAHQAYLEAPRDLMDVFHARMESQTDALRAEVEGSPENIANAVADYYATSGTVFQCDGSDLLTEFTLALAGAATLLNAIAHGDPIPDTELQAFRALCRQSKEASERQAAAVTDAVDTAFAALP